jgi:hypothetical protein
MAYTDDRYCARQHCNDVGPVGGSVFLDREEQPELDFDQAVTDKEHIGKFEEFLRLDPKKIAGIRVMPHSSMTAQEFPSTSQVVTVWTPFSEGRLLSGMAVPFNGSAMDRHTYTNLLQDRLDDLINADPKQAKSLLTGSPEHIPDLYTVALYSPPKDWAIQIMMCDQMMIRLNRIDWERGEFAKRPVDELPGLDELIELI